MTTRSSSQKVQLAAAAALVLLICIVYLVHPDSPVILNTFSQQQIPNAIVHQPAAGLSVSAGPPESAKPPEEAVGSETDALRRVCSMMSAVGFGLEQDVRHVLRWVCQQIGADVARQLDAVGCNKVVTYTPIGRLGNLLNLYALIYSYTKMYGTTSYVETGMWNNIRKYFPHISLQPTSKLPTISWKNISYKDAERHLACAPDKQVQSTTTYYRIIDYPQRNGIDIFHPFYADLRKEFQFSDRLQRQAQEFLLRISANRSSTTFIGFHIRRTDYQRYINTAYNSSLPDAEYFAKALQYYRSRYSDALFIVCSDDMSYVERTLRRPQLRDHNQTADIVIAGNRQIGDPGRDMAVLAACNHSIVTVGTYGFWGAYLAGGTVLVPERQTHLSRGDRHAPKLEIQLAGANNWIALR